MRGVPLHGPDCAVVAAGGVAYRYGSPHPVEASLPPTSDQVRAATGESSSITP